MKKKRKRGAIRVIVILIIIVVVILVVFYACNGNWQFGGLGGGSGIIPAANNTGTDGTEGADVGGTPLTQSIGISEDKIIYNDKEITLDELEALLLQYQGAGGIWELQDVYHADKSTYDEVKQLLIKMDISFVEK